MTRAERGERSTVMQRQMLLISCVAVRVLAMATMSHGTSKQRESGSMPPSAFTSVLQCEASHKNVLLHECSVFLCSESSVQVHLLEITANVWKPAFAFTFLNTQKAELLKHCRPWQINQSIKRAMTKKIQPSQLKLTVISCDECVI